MANNIQIYQIEKTEDDIRKSVLTNIIKMLTERRLLNKSDLEGNITKLVNTKSDDLIYNINLDDKEKTKLVIKILPQKVTSVSKTSNIVDFLNTHKKYHNIVIVKELSKKADQVIKSNYPNTEIFLEEDMLINIVDHDLVPKHEILTKEEIDTFYEKYNCKKRNMPKILTSDPVARYYNMKIGDICRIIRPSETSGYTVTYRLVIKG
jgi:DNA-directed RNA polymerase I, II, and III subunit RPABC1